MRIVVIGSDTRRHEGGLVLSQSPYDAWRTRDAEAAIVVARKTGGIRMLWNPIVGKVEVM